MHHIAADVTERCEKHDKSFVEESRVYRNPDRSRPGLVEDLSRFSFWSPSPITSQQTWSRAVVYTQQRLCSLKSLKAKSIEL